MGASLVFHLLMAPAEYGVYRVTIARTPDPAAGQVFVLWLTVVVLVALPYVTGSVLGGLYRSRYRRDHHWGWLRRHLSPARESRLLRLTLGHEPAPRAWEHLFGDRASAYLRVRLSDGSWVGGRFADRSYAGGYPNPTDLLLEEAWQVDQDTGELLGEGGLGYSVYIGASAIVWLERIPEASGSGQNGERR